jgi:macrolide-specific efflux system membrane fusion protein
MKKIIVILITLGLVSASVFFVFKKKSENNKDQLEIKVEYGDIVSTIRINGEVEPRNRLSIKPQIAGRIEDILVVEGQKVKKGEVIAWLSSAERATLLDIARAQGEQEYKKWQEIYKPTPVVAPLDGFIIVRDKEPGQTVSTNEDIVVMADELIIKAYVDETDLRYVKLGQKVRISLDAYPDIKFTGVVEHVSYESKQISNVTVYEVKIKPLFTKIDTGKYTPFNKTEFKERKRFTYEEIQKFNLPQEKRKELSKFLVQKDLSSILRSGMSATVEIIAEKRRNVLVLRVSAIIDNGKEKYVLVKKDDKIMRQQIETGLSDGKSIEIINGLSEGDIVVVSQEKMFKSRPYSASSTRVRLQNPISSFFRRQ